jgi:hypothetical protein
MDRGRREAAFFFSPAPGGIRFAARADVGREKGDSMGALLGLAVLLAIIWLVALVVFKVAGVTIHLILVIAVILAIVGFIRRA